MYFLQGVDWHRLGLIIIICEQFGGSLHKLLHPLVMWWRSGHAVALHKSHMHKQLKCVDFDKVKNRLEFEDI